MARFSVRPWCRARRRRLPLRHSFCKRLEDLSLEVQILVLDQELVL